MPIITIIGLDGSGKTTQARLLTQRLNESGMRTRYVRSDYILVELLSSLFGFNVDRFLPSPRQKQAGPARSSKPGKKPKLRLSTIFMIIAGYFYAWVCYVILAYYGRGKRVIVGDRYFYQFLYDIYGNASGKLARVFPRPNIAYFLDSDPELLRTRMTNPFDKAVSPEYYVKVRSLLTDLSQRYGFLIVDASQDVASISQLIYADCTSRLKKITRDVP